MKLDQISADLNNAIDNINHWKELGFVPSIEINTTLNLLANSYSALEQLKTTQGNSNHNLANQPLTPKKNPELTDGHHLFNASVPQQLLQQFIDELFWRDKTFFDNEIAKFEKLQSLDDALIYIGEKYNWTPDNNPAEKFIEILDTFYSQK